MDTYHHVRDLIQEGIDLFKSLKTKPYMNLTKKFKSIDAVYARVKQVFGSEENANAWIESPCFALGGIKPMDLMDDSEGQKKIYDILYCIEYGMYY